MKITFSVLYVIVKHKAKRDARIKRELELENAAEAAAADTHM